MNDNVKRYIKDGAIWGFIVLELIFFSVAGQFLSLSESRFMDLDNMLLLLKQSAPIGIIALGMTVVMINGNIDLSVGAIFALCGVVMLDSMSWPIFAGIGDWRSFRPLPRTRILRSERSRSSRSNRASSLTRSPQP